MTYRTAFHRALRLACPRCGKGRLFAGWFTMHPSCSHCQLPFHREPGFYLGSIYFNYGVTAILVTAAYLTLWWTEWLDPETTGLAAVAAVSVLFPLAFFRHARSLWLAFDHYWDPPPRHPDV